MSPVTPTRGYSTPPPVATTSPSGSEPSHALPKPPQVQRKTVLDAAHRNLPFFDAGGPSARGPRARRPAPRSKLAPPPGNASQTSHHALPPAELRLPLTLPKATSADAAADAEVAYHNGNPYIRPPSP
jgi:hypothetical protein